jgi:hypothetical protein
MALFTPAELREWLQYEEINNDSAVMVERVVAGWLLSATGREDLDSSNDARVFAWAVELGGIAYENPTSMTDDSSGSTSSSWADRRAQILAQAREWALQQAPAASGQLPRWSFPQAQPWPDSLR